jgi:hypothetical protein
MKSFSLFFFCVFLFSINTKAQKRKIYKINPGEKVTDIITRDEKFAYPDFISGKVYLRNETYYPAKLNYNSLFGEMQFIDPKGDTLSLADENTIKLIVINADTFYYSKGYLKQIKDYGAIKLAKMQFFSFVNRQKIGGFGEVTSASIDTYNSISGSSYFKDLVAKELLSIAVNTVFYVGDKFNNFKELNKKNLVEFYSKNEKEVQAYLKRNKIDFSNEQAILKMLTDFNFASTQ